MEFHCHCFYKIVLIKRNVKRFSEGEAAELIGRLYKGTVALRLSEILLKVNCVFPIDLSGWRISGLSTTYLMRLLILDLVKFKKSSIHYGFFSCIHLLYAYYVHVWYPLHIPAGIYFLKVNNRKLSCIHS